MLRNNFLLFDAQPLPDDFIIRKKLLQLTYATLIHDLFRFAVVAVVVCCGIMFTLIKLLSFELMQFILILFYLFLSSQ